MIDGTDARPGDEESGEDQDRALHRERQKADTAERDAAQGPGYTARPSEEGPEDEGPRTR